MSGRLRRSCEKSDWDIACLRARLATSHDRKGVFFGRSGIACLRARLTTSHDRKGVIFGRSDIACSRARLASALIARTYLGSSRAARVSKRRPNPNKPARSLFRLCAKCDAEFAQLALRDGRGRVAHQVGAARRFGERNYVADRRLTRQNHHQAIEPEGDSTMWRRAIFQSVEQEEETAPSLFIRHAERGEDLRLHVAAMNTNRAGAQFCAVQHQVVRLGAAAC